MLTLAFPAALWFLLAVPVLVLLHMLRARRRPFVVASTLLWERAARDLQTRLPVRRLERSLLLLLQILAVTLIALALARPVVAVPGVAGGAVAFVIDTSLSMQARDVSPDRLTVAKADAIRLLASLRRGQAAMLVEAAPAPRIVLEFTTDRRALLRAVRGLDATDGSSDVEGAVRLAAAQTYRGRPASVVVYTDGSGPRMGRVVYRRFLPDAGLRRHNIALVRATARSEADGRTSVLTEVRNFGESRATVTLRAAWPDGSEDETRLTISARDAATPMWTARGEGVARITVVDDDSLPADNAAEVPVGRLGRPRILLVTRGNPFLEAVLSVLQTREVLRTSSTDTALWAGFDLVVLDRLAPAVLPPGRYLLVGTTAENLPATTHGKMGTAVIRRVSLTHPVMRLADLRGVRVADVLRLRPWGGLVLAEGEAPLVWAVERAGLRALTLPFDVARSDLALHPTFPLLMANALEWLAPPIEAAAGTVAVIGAGQAREATLIDPAGRVSRLAARNESFVLPRLDRAGVYLLRSEGREQAIIVRAGTATESDLKVAAAPGSAALAEAGVRRIELWWLLLLLATVVLGLEAVLWLRQSGVVRRWRVDPRAPQRRPASERKPRIAFSPLLLLRTAVLVLLVLGVSGIQLLGAGRELAVVFALDLSSSVPAGERQRAVDVMRAAAERARPGDRFGVVAFAGGAVVAEGLTGTPGFSSATVPIGDGTDIGAGVRAALSLLPGEGGRRIVVLTDGRDTAGGATAALALAKADGIDVAVVPLDEGGKPEVTVESMHAPERVGTRERFAIQVWFEANVAAAGTLRLLAGGKEVWQGPVQVRPGRALIEIPQRAASPGTVLYEATLQAAPDTLEENNHHFAVVQVEGPPVVLYVAADSSDQAATRRRGAAGDVPPLRRWLEAQDLVLRDAPPHALPSEPSGLAGFAAVVLDDVPATVLSPAQMRALREYVGTLGGGLIAVGGPQAFGAGGYAGTDLETVLPVSMDVRHRVAMPSMAVILLLDASGSMGSFGTEIAKVELAKEAAQAVVDLLAEQDAIGVIAFDQEPHWLVRLTPARERERILEQVARITAGGGTNLYPALQEAHRALERAAAKVKHVIVLSDGQTDPGDFERLVRRMAGKKITVSTVAIGNDADREIMRNIAAWGRGRAYYTRDLYTIPQIFTAEALLATRAYLIEEKFRPAGSPDSEILRGLSNTPALRGYVATAAKPAATLHMLSHEEDPVLASWQYGLGRAAAFTSDARARWAREWMAWPDAPRFWSRIVRWAMGITVPVMDVHADVEGSGVRVVLDARSSAGDFLTDLTAQARIAGTQLEAALTQTAPGRYEALMPLPPQGAHLVSVEARRGRILAGVGRAAFVVPYSPELRTAASGGLARLVEASGVRVIRQPGEIVAPVPGSRKHRPAWPVLSVIAMGLFLSEITLRRLPAISEWAARAGAAVMGWMRQATPTEPVEEDQEYEAADRWRVVRDVSEQPVEDAGSRPGMGEAARLYIARLRKQQHEDRGER